MTDLNRSMVRQSSSEQSRWQRWWLLPLIYVVSGAIILIAEGMNGDLTSGIVWFGVMAGVAEVYGLGGRFELIRQARGDFSDERDAYLNRRAMAATGTVLVIALTGCIVYQLARGENPHPYSTLMGLGGVTYIGALFVNRYRS